MSNPVSSLLRVLLLLPLLLCPVVHAASEGAAVTPTANGDPRTAESPVSADNTAGVAEDIEEAGAVEEAGAAEEAGEAGVPADGTADTANAAENVNASALPRDLSPWGMYSQADWVVKAVMIGLALASLITWTVLLAKSWELRRAATRETRILRLIDRATTIEEARAGLADTVGSPHLDAVVEELKLSSGALDDREGVKERVVSRLDQLGMSEGRSMAKGTGVLATIGATAPFVGLFGTVWGIMNSFIGISKSQTTNLAVVAPGIAEALLATALGLVAAIPAVIIYNHFARRITAYKAVLADISGALLRLVSRDLSRRAVAGHDTVAGE